MAWVYNRQMRLSLSDMEGTAIKRMEGHDAKAA